MSLLTRITQKVFGSSASNIGQFGSGQLGTKVITSDPAVIQALAAFAGGWSDSVMGSNKFPPIEEMNAMDFLATRQLAYLFQEGIAEYDSGTTYSQYALVKNPGTFQLYGSIVTNNTGNALNNAAAWQFLFDMSAISSNLYTGGVSTGSANAQVVASVTPAAGFSLRNGVAVTATAGFSNTGSTSLNVAGTGVTTIQKQSGGSLVNLAGGEITNGQLFTVQYNSSAGVWVLTSVVSANYLQVANNLSDLGSVATALQNLGFANTSSNYFKIPNPNNPSKPWIVQFGVASVGGNANQAVSLPVTFPTTFVSAYQSSETYVTPNQATNIAQRTSTSVITIYNLSSTSSNFSWLAIGN